MNKETYRIFSTLENAIAYAQTQDVSLVKYRCYGSGMLSNINHERSQVEFIVINRHDVADVEAAIRARQFSEFDVFAKRYGFAEWLIDDALSEKLSITDQSGITYLKNSIIIN